VRIFERQQTLASTFFAVISAGEVDQINPVAVWSFPHYNAFAS
jgi:hypothetical protein